LDADSFYSDEILEILTQKNREIVITPHPKEFSSLWEKLTGEVWSVAHIQQNRFDAVRNFNEKYPHVTLLLKGANTLIMQEEKLYINSLGCSKLSKGGSGDVLSGLIVSLLAQGYTGIDAAIQGSLALVTAAGRLRLGAGRFAPVASPIRRGDGRSVRAGGRRGGRSQRSPPGVGGSGMP